MNVKQRNKIIEYLCSITENITEATNFLQLYLTNRCQFNCRYCKLGIARDDMRIGVIKKTIDFLLSSKLQQVRLQFFGGEPLLRFDLIEEATRYIKDRARQRRKRFELLIATNGILLTEDKLRFFEENNFIIVFSFDGIRETQNFNRPPFKKQSADKIYNLIEDNLINLAESKINFFVNVVVGPDNIHRLKENVDFLISRGVKNIRLSYMMGVFWKTDNIKRYFNIVTLIFNKCKHLIPSVEIRACTDEPVLVSSGIAVTNKKDMFVGTTFSLKYRFPDIERINHYGNIGQFSDINQVKRNRRDEVKRALEISSSNDREFRLLANNIFLGINYQRLFRKLLAITEADLKKNGYYPYFKMQ